MRGCLVALAATSALAVLWVLGYAGRGFSFSDEGFYLNWMSHAPLYKYSSTQFGFVYRPLYRLVSGDVAHLRGANLILSFALALEVGALIFRQIGNGYEPAHQDGQRANPWKKWWCYALAAPVALAAWSMPHSWLPTPSYNTLVLQGFLLAVLALLRLSASASKLKPVWSTPVLLAAGLWVSGMAKPTSAALLLVAILLYATVVRRLTWRLFWTTALITFVLFVLSIIWIDGSISGFITRLRGGMQLGELLGAGHGMGQMAGRVFTDRITFSPVERSVALAALAISAFATRCVTVQRAAWHRYGLLGGLALTIATVVIIWTDADLPYQWASFEWLLILFPAIGCALGRMAWQGRKTALTRQLSDRTIRIDSGAPLWKHDRLALGTLLVVLPHLSAFGSNNNIWLQGGYAAVFWAYGGIVLASCVQGRVSRGPAEWVPVVATMQLIAVVVLSVTISHPYTQTASLRLQRTPVTLHDGATRLVVTADVAAYLQALQSVARDAGFHPGDVVIDLTGYYAASLFALSAKPIGSAWLIGGQSGSEAVALAAFDLVRCEDLANAWLLVQPQGPIRLPGEILSRYGINIGTDYESVGSIKAPWPIPGMYFEQELMRPRRSFTQSLAGCKAAREGTTSRDVSRLNGDS